MLESVPRLNAGVHWEELDTGELLVTYERDARGLKRVLARLLVAPRTAQVVLDKIGSRVVKQIDGAKTVADLVGFVSEEFKLSRKEAEVALLKYLALLGKRNFVGFDVRPVAKETM